MSKYDDYDKVVKVIQSCVNSSQNNIAYRMIWNFNDMHKDHELTLRLFHVCDKNLISLGK